MLQEEQPDQGLFFGSVNKIIYSIILITGGFLKEFKDKDYCPIEIIKGLTDKGQFQYLTKLMGPQEGTYLYATQSHSLR